MLRLDANHCIQLSNWALKTEFRLLSLAAIFPSPRQLYKARNSTKEISWYFKKYCVSQPFCCCYQKQQTGKNIRENYIASQFWRVQPMFSSFHVLGMSILVVYVVEEVITTVRM